MLKNLLMIGCLLISPLHGFELDTGCTPPDNQQNFFHTYPSTCPTGPINATQTYPADYPPYPGIAYERSVSTAQIVTAVLVGTAFFVIVGIALTNTPKHHGRHSHHCHSR